MELYNRVRPTSFNQMLGNETAIKSLMGFIKTKTIPHAIAMLGPTGTGKTTASKILASKLDCGPGDFIEINGSDNNGINTIREIKSLLYLHPAGSARVWYIDEAHMLTKDAQNALLKMLEEPPKTAYFILATTDEHKLLATVIGRCTKVLFKCLTPKLMRQLLIQTAKSEKLVIEDRVADLIINVADGSARVALKLLEQVQHTDSEEEALELIQSSDTRLQAFEIFRALANPHTKWPDMISILNKVEENPEKIRRLVLECVTTRMLKAGKGTERAFAIYQVFRDHWYDCGRAGLVGSCYDVITAGK